MNTNILKMPDRSLDYKHVQENMASWITNKTTEAKVDSLVV
jgi:hypothetical protein